jgi:hypothetical protein
MNFVVLGRERAGGEARVRHRADHLRYVERKKGAARGNQGRGHAHPVMLNLFQHPGWRRSRIGETPPGFRAAPPWTLKRVQGDGNG